MPTDKLGLKNGQLILRATWRPLAGDRSSTHQMRELSGLHPVDAEAHFNQGLPKWNSHWGIDYIQPGGRPTTTSSEVDVQRLGTWVDAFFEYKPRPISG